MTPALNTLSSQGIGGSVEKQAQADTVPVNSPAWQSQLQNALQQISGGATGSSLGAIKGRGVDTSAYPLPSGSSGYFVISTNPQSPYLIMVTWGEYNTGSMLNAAGNIQITAAISKARKAIRS